MRKLKDLRNDILLIVLLLSGIASATTELLQKEENNWESILYRGLHSYYQDEYQNSYELIENAVRNSKPGPEVHRCLALMQLSFYRMHNLDLLVLVKKIELSNSAVNHIRNLEAIQEPNDIDLVILSTLKGARIYNADVKIILDKIINSASSWQDLAYWQKARIVASELSWGKGEINDMGIVEFKDSRDQHRLGCIVTRHPEEVFRGRAARIFLKKHPNTYMARQMELDMIGGYMRDVFEAYVILEEYYTKNKSQYFNEAQLDVIRENYQEFKEIGKLFPKNVRDLFEAERGLDELLYTGAPSKKIILKYLKAIIEVKGENALPESVYEWVSSSAL